MRGVIWFLIISFVLAWGAWEAAIRSGVSVLSWKFQLYALPGAFAPAIAAIVVRKWITREGFADAGLRLNLARWRYYLFAWLLPLLVVAAILLQALVYGIGAPDFTLARAVAAEPAGRDMAAFSQAGLLIVPQVLLTAVLLTPVLWGEEFGWRGYLQARLLTDRPIAAAAATGVIWGLWHLPVTLRGYDYPDHPVLGSLLLTVIAALLAYIFDWVRRRGGSIWAASLAHSATNSVGALSVLWLSGTAGPFIISYGGLLAVPPLLLVCAGIHWREQRDAERMARAGAPPAPAAG